MASESFATHDSFGCAAKGFSYVGRQLGRTKQSPPRRGLKAVVAGLGNRRYARQRWGAHLAADGNGTQLARLHIRQHRLQRVEHDLKLTTYKIGHRWSAAPIGYMLDVDARNVLEHFAGEMTRGAGARGAVVELSGHTLRKRHQFSNIAHRLRRMRDDRHRGQRYLGDRRALALCI